MNMSDIPIYEQCKELEKENAELKALIAQRDKSITAQTEIILNLKAENERLKRENEIITGMHNSSSNRFDKLYNTLQEIKAIAERQLLVTNVRTYQMVYYADFSQYRNEILDLITKAEEE